MAYTLADLRGEIRDLTDISGSAFHNDYDLNKYINKSLGSLQSLMVNTFDGSYFIATGSYDITTTASTQDYDFSALNPWKVISVSYNDGSYDYIMEPAAWSERHDLQTVEPTIIDDVNAPYRYLLFGNRIKVIPAPPANKTIKLFYIPKWSNLTSDSDVIDAQIPEHYLTWAIADVAMKIKIKSEEPTQEVMALKQDIERLIREDANNRITKQIRYAPDVSDSIPWWRRTY